MIQAHIITLTDHDLSQRLADDCINQASKYGIKVNKFNAIWGKDIGQHLPILDLKVNPLAPPSKLTPNMCGNFLSHYYLWLACAESNVPYIILEHDGYFIKPLPNGFLNKFTDVLKLDSINPYSKDYNEVIEREYTLPLSIRKITPSKTKAAGGYSWGSYAYIIKPLGAQKIISWVKHNGFLSTDNQLALGVVDVQTCYPTIARLHPFFSIGDNIYTYSTALNK